MKHIKIGKIVATFGVAGDVIIIHSLGKKTTFKNVEVLFVEQTKNSLLPYFIVNAKAKNEEETNILFDALKTKEAAKILVGKNVWLLQDDFKKVADKNAPIALLGYTVFDNDVEVGIVDEVIEQPHQILLTVNYKNQQAYLPLHQESLLEIDHKKSSIYLDLPEGLLDIYANEDK